MSMMNLITQNGNFTNKNLINGKNCFTINQNIGTSNNEKKIGNCNKIFGIMNCDFKYNYKKHNF